MKFRNALALFTVALVGLAAWFPPAEDELYYWTWAKKLSLSYYDHPPMIAWLIALTTGLFGDSLLALRLAGPAAAAGTLWLLARLAPEPDRLLPYLLCPAFLVFSVFLTPDVPLLFFWALYLVVIATLVDDEPPPLSRWLVAGLVLGLGLLSKYTMALAGLSTILALTRTRAVFRRSWPGYLLHGVVALLVFSPVLVYNVRHDYAPFLFQLKRSMPVATWHSVLEFLAVQTLLWSALPLVSYPLAAARWRALRGSPRAWTALVLSAAPLTFFLATALRQNIEANWPAPAYLGLIALSAGSAPLRRAAFLPAILFSAYFIGNAIHPLPVGPAGNDRYRLVAAKWALAKTVAADAPALAPGEPLFAFSYQWTSALRFAGVDAEHAYPAGRRSQFTLEPKNTCERRSIVAFVAASNAAAELPCFDRRETLKEYSLTVRNERIGSYQLMRFSRQ